MRNIKTALIAVLTSVTLIALIVGCATPGGPFIITPGTNGVSITFPTNSVTIPIN